MALSEEITCEEAASQAAMAGKWLRVFVKLYLKELTFGNVSHFSIFDLSV